MATIADSSADAGICGKSHLPLHLRLQMAQEIRLLLSYSFLLHILHILLNRLLESRAILIDFCFFSSFSSEEKYVEEGEKEREKEDKVQAKVGRRKKE